MSGFQGSHVRNELQLQVNELLFGGGSEVGSGSCAWMLLRIACSPVSMKESLPGCVVIVAQ